MREIIEKIKIELENLDFDSWNKKEEVIEFKDFNLKIEYTECEQNDCHPNYSIDITFDNCKFFEELRICELSDCYMCNKEARKELMEEILNELEIKINKFYNEEAEIDKRIEIYKKQINEIEEKINKLKIYKMKNYKK